MLGVWITSAVSTAPYILSQLLWFLIALPYSFKLPPQVTTANERIDTPQMISPPYSTITNTLYNSDEVSESVSIDKDSDISTSTKISTEILPQTPKKVNNEGVAPITSS